ncbi:uncharacterized protein F5Z01DRAFT_753977 [Emericellopsis atlantica]|uniref:Uncharacterized protein n=1 Tax=Emericellopsis atlantica TaxID=2614577 RepID=A0A9P8CK32_9HYPO|nr:uncharacterized protein F5Z01DRAFT_753977 [Emericellopsis atlantica]KAG9250124.1 hypothetical protein F5Z01DRAFT_753977 [Emericellopsis atlantica]
MDASDDYVLGRGAAESVRLDAQHLLWRLHQGYLLHPSISVTRDMRIAEVGTGTASSPIQSSFMATTISDRQFPHHDLLPENVTLGLLNSLEDTPSELHDQYDVVHLRMWASNLRSRNVNMLIQNIEKMLKPGGFIQWEEADLMHQVVKTDAATTFEANINELPSFMKFANPLFALSWVHDLPKSFELQGFEVKHAEHKVFQPSQVQLCTNTYLLALKEIIAGIKSTSSQVPGLNIGSHEEALAQLLENHTRVVYNWGPLSLLAQTRRV